MHGGVFGVSLVVWTESLGPDWCFASVDQNFFSLLLPYRAKNAPEDRRADRLISGLIN